MSEQRGPAPTSDLLLRALRSERKRWHDIRVYALETRDLALSQRMDEASKAYAERNQVQTEKLYTIAEVNRMLRAAGWGPFCSNPDCRCVIPLGEPCSEFKKMPGKMRCAECGWPEKEHNTDAVD